jgi:hypothetical protein
VKPGQKPNAQVSGGRTFDREAFEKFRETHKYTFQLTTLLRNIGRLERDGKNKLTAAQAKSLLDALTPLRAQEHMTQDDAKAAIRDVQKVLTEDQRNEIAALPERSFGGPGGGQGGNRGGMQGGGPGGPPPGGGGGMGGGRTGGPRMTMDNNFNPLRDTGDGRGGRMGRFFDELKTKAGQ